MKQITFNYFRHLLLMLLAVVGFTTSTFAQDWEEVVYKPLTSITEEGLVNGTNRSITTASPWQIGPSLNLSAGASNSDNYIAVKSNNVAEGTYKFSYKIFPLGNSGNIHFFYCKEGDEANKNEVSVTVLSNLSTNSATVIETPEFEIPQAGTYLFGWYCDTFGADIYFCDFYLYKKVVTAPAETWTEVHFNSLSGSKANEINLDNDPYYIYPGTASTSNWNTTNSYGASETADKYGPYIKTVSEGYYLAYRYDVEKSATYRFSFLHKKAGSVETTAKLCYTTSLSEAFIDASDIVALEKKGGEDPGVLFQSNNIELEKGSYYFMYYIVSGGESKVRIADFKLEMLDGSAVEPAMPAITIMKPVNGNLTINYLNGEVMEEISTYEFEEDSKVYNIPENTVLSITANPEAGYVLDTILPEGMVEKTGKGGDTYYEYTVTGDATIEATFIEEEILYGKVSVVEPLEAEGTIEIQLYNVLFGSWRPAADFFLESVEYGMQLRAKVDANEGYAIESVKKNDEIITANEEDGCYYFTVDAADIKISATFTKVGEKYAQEFGTGVGDTGWGYRNWTNTVFKTSTDGEKTVEVNYITNIASYEIYSDALVSEDNKATVYQGETFDLTINGGMNWLYTKVYIDWNGDGVFDEAVDGTENLGYNPVNEREFGDNTPTKPNTRTYTVNVPQDALAGDTRVRIILGWKQENVDLIPDNEEKVAKYITSTTIDDKKNAMVRDFSLNIKEATATPEHNITVKKPANGDLVISYLVNDEMNTIETYSFENDSEVYSIAEGTVLSISVNPEFDYVLDNILPEGMEEKTGRAGDKYYEYTVTGDATIEATFKPIQYGKVSFAASEEGTIEIQLHNPMMDKWVPADEFFLEQVEFGTELRAKVEANTGYDLVSVNKNQDELTADEADGHYYFTVDAEEITISAVFEAKTFTLTTNVTPEEGGSVSVKLENNEEAGATVKYGEIITVTAVANEGYLVDYVEVSGADEIDGQSSIFKVTGDVIITAAFKKDPSSINSISATAVYYDSEEETLYTNNAASVKVYDLSGRLVLNTGNQAIVSLAELAEGVYTAVVDGKVVKLNK